MRGACRLGDFFEVPANGSSERPSGNKSSHRVQVGSGDVFINFNPTLRAGDAGPVEGTQGDWICLAGCGSVLVNGRPIARGGDPVSVQTGVGQMTSESENVVIGCTQTEYVSGVNDPSVVGLVRSEYVSIVDMFSRPIPRQVVEVCVGDEPPFIAITGEDGMFRVDNIKQSQAVRVLHFSRFA
jgi:uncharacterized Zn-binding protein involved in type VI secretion